MPGETAVKEGDKNADDCPHKAYILMGGRQEAEDIKAKSIACFLESGKYWDKIQGRKWEERMGWG